MADIELFQQSGYTNDTPTGADLNDRLAFGATGKTIKNMTISKFYTLLNNVLGFLKPSNNLSDVSSPTTARTNLSVYSKAESDAAFFTKTNATALGNRLGGLTVQIVGSVSSDGLSRSTFFSNGAWSAARVSSGRYRLSHNIPGLKIIIGLPIDSPNIAFRSSVYVDENNADLYFADDASGNEDTAFRFIVYSVAGF